MKVLVISLLRIGDLILHGPAIGALRKKYPGAEFHLLINRQTAGLIPLMKGIHRVHFFEREILQEALTKADRSLLESISQLEELVRGLKTEKFDLAVNLTQNRLSGYLTSAIEARDVLGLQMDSRGRSGFGSTWFRYLNDRAEEKGREILHYADIFRLGAADQEDWEWPFAESLQGESEAQNLVGRERPLLIQPLTSDSKKNWGLENWLECLRPQTSHAKLPPILILGAPSEREALMPLRDRLLSVGRDAQLGICSLEGAYSLLKRARVLITGDTSIKHLAAAANCPVIELSLGSSDWRRQGAYTDGSLILQSKEDCAPCPHSRPCPWTTHRCAQRLRPEVVAGFLAAVLTPGKEQLASLARQVQGDLEVRRTVLAPGQIWQTLPVGRELELGDFRLWLDRVSTQLALSGAHQKRVGDFGSEGLKLRENILRQSSVITPEMWREMVGAMDRETRAAEQDSADAQKRFKKFVQESQRESQIDLTGLRKLQGRVDDVAARLEVRRRLVRSLLDRSMEAI